MGPSAPALPAASLRTWSGGANGSAVPGTARRRSACRLLAAVIVWGALLAPSSARVAEAAPFEASDTSWEGGSKLYAIAKAELGETRVRVVKVLDWSELTPADGVLVLHPSSAIEAAPSDAFMKAGGRLAIVDDFGQGDRTLRRFKIERTRAPARPVASLRNNPELPLAEPAFDAARGGGPHPVVAGVQRLVLNHPTALIHPNLSPVLKVRAIGEPEAIVAVAGQVGDGRLFAMSDPSALIDAMLRYPGNRAFATGLVRYLVDPVDRPGGPGRLFIVANDFSQEGGFGGDETLADALEGQIEGMLSALADARREGLPPWALATIAGALAVVTAAWVWRTSARPYASPLPRYARPVPLVARGGVAGRFAMLAAPSSPRSLAVLELKSALYEAVAEHQAPGATLGSERVLEAVRERGGSAIAAPLRDVLRAMARIEAAVVAGRRPRVAAAELRRATEVVGRALEALGAPGATHADPAAGNHAPPGVGASPHPASPTAAPTSNEETRTP